MDPNIISRIAKSHLAAQSPGGLRFPVSGDDNLTAAQAQLQQAEQALRAAADRAQAAFARREILDDRIATQLNDMAKRVENVRLEIAPLARTFRNSKLAHEKT